jgi:hypothetical protein
MTEISDTKTILIALMKELGLEPGVPCSLYKIGPPLVGQTPRHARRRTGRSSGV